MERLRFYDALPDLSPRDFLRRPIRVGSRIAYAVRRSTKLTLHLAQVIGIYDQILDCVRQSDGRSVRIRNLKTVLVVDP